MHVDLHPYPFLLIEHEKSLSEALQNFIRNGFNQKSYMTAITGQIQHKSLWKIENIIFLENRLNQNFP